ncbi:MAG: 50S ribosomal protein L3 [Candidatus Gastranaerophilaceae bacterium]|jgi:large subunit ribosomal protein L3
MTLGVVGEKLGMTQIYDANGLVIPVTVIKVDPLTVTQVKTVDNDGYSAVQVGTNPCKEKHLTNAQIKHLSKNNLPALRVLKEFRVEDSDKYTVGDKIDLSILVEGSKVDITGKSIGKGFQGTVKRHNFSRGPMAHGSKNHREPGSIGAGTTPGRVIKGKKMAGNMGNENVTVAKLEVVKVDLEKNLLLVRGSVPGPEGKLVTVKPSITKWN